MKRRFLFFALCLSFFFIHNTASQEDSARIRLLAFAESVNEFAQNLPQETVYLHFDNTSYYQGDDIWFACYVVTNEMFKPTDLSKTLYVELLNQGGEIIDKRILKIDSFGQCNGNFTLNRLPFYSGFYEVRAYTKYMLNFGEDAIFSRTFPVFDKPKTEGDFADRKMPKYWYQKFPEIRKRAEKAKNMNLKFYPEGGKTVRGVQSKIAFEATDENGNPLNICGKIINDRKTELAQFSTMHEGTGVFDFTPNEEKTKAIVIFENKEYRFDLPAFENQGFVMTVDNLSDSDSIEISIAKNAETPAETLGIAVLTRGILKNLVFCDIADDSLNFKIDKTVLPAGVSRIILFNPIGNILSDRLVFTGKPPKNDIQIKTDKSAYQPYEKVEMEFSLTNPTPFSVSVRDAENEVEYNRNILTDLLLMSEIKGFVRNPKFYFEEENHAKELDLLLMVQGWRRYSWEEMIGAKPFELKYLPEKGIAMSGKVVSMVRSKPKANVQISCFISRRSDGKVLAETAADALVTDSLGKFEFVADLEGKWNLVMAVSEKGKAKDHRIVLDRLFSPAPRRYEISETQVNIADFDAPPEEPETVENDSIAEAIADSLANVGMMQKVHVLQEVVVKGKKHSKERDIYEARRKSSIYYDVLSEVDKVKDNNGVPYENFKAFLFTLCPNKRLLQNPLFVINYKQRDDDFDDCLSLRLEAIKSIYISEDDQAKIKYAPFLMSPMEAIWTYSCVVFVETPLEGSIMVEDGKGVRKTWFEGYTPPTKTFYSPDYSVEQIDDDYRRTIYWNPAIVPDSAGKTKIRFYNNGSCWKFAVSAETVTVEGEIVVITR